jgi:hypothetical protein
MMHTTVQRTRRVCTALWRFSHLPKWVVVAFGICLAIPGPFDEMALSLAVMLVIAWRLRSKGNRVLFVRMMVWAWMVAA